MADNTITVLVPLSTDVVVKAFTNADYLQRITVVLPALSNPIVFQGQGEGNNPIGRAHFTTPNSWPNSISYPISVTQEYSVDEGQNWQPSTIYGDHCVVQAFNLTVVVSEDGVDDDWNDAVCMISWPQAQV